MKSLNLTHSKNLLMLIVLFSINAKAQDTSVDRTITSQQYLPQYQSKSQTINDSVTEVRLIDLALSQPQIEQAESQIKIADLQLKKQRQTWLNLLSISANYNDQTFAPKSTTATYVYPKYFFGVTVPLGLIFAGGTDYKISHENAVIVKDQEMQLKQSIKAEVISDYRQYLAYTKLLALQNQVVDDEQAGLLQIQQKFKNGTTTFEAYNTASKAYNDEVVKTINLQLQKDLVKVAIEKLIGRKMEDIFK